MPFYSITWGMTKMAPQGVQQPNIFIGSVQRNDGNLTVPLIVSFGVSDIKINYLLMNILSCCTTIIACNFILCGFFV